MALSEYLELVRVGTGLSLAAVFVVGLVWSFWAKWSDANHLGLLATTLVAAVTMFADDSWVYFVAVLLIAAPIAGPTFVQNLAAILLNRSWGIANQGVLVPPASEDRSDEEAAFARMLDQPLTQMERGALFHRMAQEALSRSALARLGAEIRTEVALQRADGRRVFLDAVAVLPDGSAQIFEFKATESHRRIREAAQQLAQYREWYEEAANRPVRGAALVIPSGGPARVNGMADIQILHLDMRTGMLESSGPGEDGHDGA